MSCRILVDRDDGRAVFICSTSDVAFGPIMESAVWAHAFTESLGRDPRGIDVNDLIGRWGTFFSGHQECRCGAIIEYPPQIVDGRAQTMCDDCRELERNEAPCGKKQS